MGRQRSIETRTLAAELEADIVEGRLHPGDRLEERGLGERFGVSRTPVREALRRLAAIGLVQEQAGSGCIVARTTLSELMSMFEFMNEVEASAARLAARRIDGAAKGLLIGAVRAGEESAAAGDVLAYSRTNREFHELIYRASGNPSLIDAIRRVSARAAPFRRQALGLRGWIERSAREHGAIAAAIAAHDVTRAGELMTRHMNIFGRKDFPLLVSLLADQLTGQADGTARRREASMEVGVPQPSGVAADPAC